MLYSRLALIVTFLELIVTAIAISLNRGDLISDFIIFGSPIYVVSHISEFNPFVPHEQLSYLLIFSFHAFKYVFLARAFLAERPNMARNMALVMEILYLFICGYYMYL